MSEMVERVARAMYELKFRNEGFAWADSMVQDEWRDLARAAIAAMREPTDAMVEFGNVGGTEMCSGDALSTWQDMIDEALK